MKALKDCHSDVIDVYGYGIQVITALDAWHKQLRELISSGQVDNLNRSVALGLDSPHVSVQKTHRLHFGGVFHQRNDLSHTQTGYGVAPPFYLGGATPRSDSQGTWLQAQEQSRAQE